LSAASAGSIETTAATSRISVTEIVGALRIFVLPRVRKQVIACDSI